MLKIKNAKVLIDGTFLDRDIVINDGVFTRIDGEACNDEGAEVFDAKGMRMIPGFIDIHTHGAVGIDINNATPQDLEQIGRFFATKGTTTWLGSILTDTKEQVTAGIKAYKAYKQMPHTGAEMVGIHLEGPFLSDAYRGAHPQHLLCEADVALIREYQELAEGDIKYITVSPEAGVTPKVIKELVALGIVVAVGHSGADYDTTMACIDAGAMASTHTFNAMKPLHHHEPGMSGAVLESNIYCEAICDGRHLHPAMVRLIIKTKGIDKTLLVTDSIQAAGLEDGYYTLGVNDIVVKDGDAKLVSDGTRAGSTLTMEQAFHNVLAFTGLPIEKVMPLLGENQAKLMGMDQKVSTISQGKQADFILLDEENKIAETFIRGVRFA